jgi:inosose dehydratase
MLSRREFLGAGVGVALGTRALAASDLFALPGDKMRYAMSGHQFRTTPPHPETGIRMTAAYGYHGLEPFQDDMPQYIQQPPQVFKDLLDEAGIALATVGSGGQYLDPVRFRDTLQSNGERARYVAHFGCTHLKINLGGRVGPEDLTVENARILARHLNEVGRRTLDEGVRFAFHPHAWHHVERQVELDMIMDMTDPSLVFLTLDTGHATLGGIDPIRALRDYYPRVAAIHLKDAEAKYNTANGWRGPAPSQEEHARTNLYKRLGSGGVDFPEFFRVLREREFDGWVTMDFDAPRPGEGTVQEDMDRHRRYLVEVLQGDLRPV